MTPARHLERLRKQIVSENDYYTGTIVVNDGEGEICYQMGIPTNAVLMVEGERITGMAALEQFGTVLSRPLRIKKEQRIGDEFSLEGVDSEQIWAYLQREPEAEAGPYLPTGVERRVAPVVEQVRRGEATFPLLPLGKPIIASTPPGVALPLDIVIPSLPTALLILTSDTGLRAGAIVQGGKVVDALWTEGETRLLGRTAAKAVLDNQSGFISGYTLADELVAGVSALWRMPVAQSDLDANWLDPGRFLGAMLDEGVNRVVLVRLGEERGVMIVLRGEIVTAYTTSQPTPETGTSQVLELISNPLARVTVLEGEAGGERVPNPLVPEEVFHSKAEEAAFAAPDEGDELGRESNQGEIGSEAEGQSSGDLGEEDRRWEMELAKEEPNGNTDDLTEAEEGITLVGQGGHSKWLEEVEDLAPETVTSSFFGGNPGAEEKSQTRAEESRFARLIEDDELVEVEESVNSAGVQPDWEGYVIPLLIGIAERYLQANATSVVESLRAMDHSAEGVRDTLVGLGKMELPGATPDLVQLMARNMLFRVSEDLTGI